MDILHLSSSPFQRTPSLFLLPPSLSFLFLPLPSLWVNLFVYFCLFLLPLPLSLSVPLPLRPSLLCWSKCARENTFWTCSEHILWDHILADIKSLQRMYVTWLIRVCNMTHSYVRHDSYTCVTFSYVWHAHSYVWLDSSNVFDAFMCVTWLISESNSLLWMPVIWHVSHINVCDMTH